MACYKVAWKTRNPEGWHAIEEQAIPKAYMSASRKITEMAGRKPELIIWVSCNQGSEQNELLENLNMLASHVRTAISRDPANSRDRGMGQIGASTLPANAQKTDVNNVVCVMLWN